MSVLENFCKEIKNIAGKECWGIVGGPDTGSVISLSLGEKYPRKAPSKNTHFSQLVRNNDPEYSLVIKCPWRIENSKEILCGSHHTNENDGPYQRGFDKIIGTNLVSVSCLAPAFDLKLAFTNGVVLNVFCTLIGMDENECYSLGSPEGWFGVCFDGKIEIDKNV